MRTATTRAIIAGIAALAALQISSAQERAGERPAVVTEIPGVIAAGSKWEFVWQDFKTADGIVGTPDGGVLFAQEQSDTLRKLDANHRESVFLADMEGPGAVSMDAQGRVYVVQRTCTDPGRADSKTCAVPTKVSLVSPEKKVLADKFGDGKVLGRLNDLIADGKGGAYFTVGGAYYVSPEGVVSTVAEPDIRSNGIMLSADGKTLFVTSVTRVLAFDVQPDGTTKNRRDFGALNGDEGADGMAIDSAGRLYVTARQGVHVLDKTGRHIGLIPTPRPPITLAFSGPDKRTMYVPMMGAVGPDGKPWTTPQGVRNTGMSIYRIRVITPGFAGRPK